MAKGLIGIILDYIFDSNWNNMTKEKYDDIYEKEIKKLADTQLKWVSARGF